MPIDNPQDRQFTHEQLTIDPDIQRALVPGQLARMTGDKFNAAALGQLLVSQRSNGARVILDGQHRWHAVRLMAPQTPLDCRVFSNLTRQEEAQLFLASNNQSGVSPQAKFKTAVVAGLELPVAVDKILTKYGLEIGNGAQDFAAVADALRVATWPGGLELLDKALDILTSAWADAEEDYSTPLLAYEKGNRPYRGQLVIGLCRVLHRYGKSVDATKMVASLRSLGDRGPAIISENAQRLRSSLGRVTLDQVYAHSITKAYNRSKGMRLPDWELSTREGEDGQANHALNVLLTAEAGTEVE